MKRLMFTKRIALPTAGVMLATLLLNACTQAPRPTAAEPASAVATIPAVLVGTWLELASDGKAASDSKSAAGGFLAIGNNNVVVNLAGQARVVGKPLEIALENGIGAGRMTLDNGLRLYLVSGRGAVPGAPTGMLALAACIDVELFRVDGTNEHSLGRTRVWAQEAVQTQQAMRALQPATTVVATTAAKPVAAAASAAPAATWPRSAADRAFYATAAGTLAPRAERLIRLAERGANADALRAAWSNEADAVRHAQLDEIEALAHAEPGQTRRHLDELAARQKQWLAFVDAFTRWAQASRS